MSQEISFLEIVSIAWAEKFKISLPALLVSALVFLATLLMPNVYIAGTLLAPVDEASGGGISALAERFGGLAGLAGVSLGAGDNGKINVGLEVLESRKFIKFFIEKNDLMIPLMAANGWDRETGELLIDKDKYDSQRGIWVRSVFRPYEAEPSHWEAYEEFISKITVKYEKDTGMLKLAIESFSPVDAKNWLELFVRDLNLFLKDMDVQDAKNSINYLNEQLNKTNIDDMKKIFYELIQEQTKIVMLAETRSEYMFRTIDPPVVAIEHSKPKRLMLSVISGLMVGIFIFCVFVVAKLKR